MLSESLLQVLFKLLISIFFKIINIRYTPKTPDDEEIITTKEINKNNKVNIKIFNLLNLLILFNLLNLF